MNDWKTNRHRRAQAATDRSTLDREARTVRAVLATDRWIDGPFGPERLLMSPSAIDTERSQHGLPLHDDHGPHLRGNTGERVGIVEDITAVGGELVGTLRASRSDAGERVLADIEDRIITHVSIGYRVDDARPTEDGLLITRWTPLEVSTPSVVADTAATIQRGMNMDNDQTATEPVDTESIREEVRAEERQRIQAIETAFAPFPGATALRTRALGESWTAERANSELLAWLGTQHQATGRGPDVSAGATDLEKFAGAASLAIQARALVIPEDEAAQVRASNDFFGWRLSEIAREYLRLAGDPVRGSSYDIVGQALTRQGIISHGTSDFANLLVDAANKALQMGYNEAGETYAQWTGVGSIADFKPLHNPQISTFSDLDEIGENGEFTYGTFSDAKEVVTLATYGKLFSITRQAIINDDLGAFTIAPRAMARAASRKVGDLVYSVLSTNAAMSDGNALFSAAHSNYVAAGSGGAPAVATLNTAYTAMATQTDPAGNTIGNVMARYILAPHALRGTTDALLTSMNNPAEGGTTSFEERNIWMGSLTPIYDARIDADDAAKWYLATDPGQFETIKVFYLNGVQTPRLEREEGFTIDGVTMKVAHDAAAAPLDWRGLYHNDGN